MSCGPVLFTRAAGEGDARHGRFDAGAAGGGGDGGDAMTTIDTAVCVATWGGAVIVAPKKELAAEAVARTPVLIVVAIAALALAFAAVMVMSTRTLAE